MQEHYRWTVRGIDEHCVAMVAEVSETSGLAYGTLLNEAISFWYEALPVEGESADLECEVEEAGAPDGSLTDWA